MLLKCEKNGLIFKGRKLIKGEVIEVNSIDDLGANKGLFSDIEKKETVKIEKKSKKGAKQ